MSLDDIREAIEEAMEEGFEVTAEDLEGRDCAHCGDLIPFTEWPENVVTWDVRVQEPGEPKEPYIARYYYCSEDCKKQAKLSGQDVEAGDPDIIHEDEIDDETLIADGGVDRERARGIAREIYWKQKALSRIGAEFAEAMESARHEFYWNLIGWVPASENLEVES